jgi:hypothetical protein
MHRVAVSVVLVRLAVTVKLLGEVGDPACDCLLRLLEALLNVLADLRQVVCSELVVTCGDCRTGRTIEEAVLSVGFVGPLPRLLPPLAMATLALARGTALALVVFCKLSRVYLVLLELGPLWSWRLRRGRLFCLEVGVRHAQQRVEGRLDLAPASDQHCLDDIAVNVREGFDQRVLRLLLRGHGPRGLGWGDFCGLLVEAHAGLGRLGRRRRCDRLVGGSCGGSIVVVVKVKLARRRGALGRLNQSVWGGLYRRGVMYLVCGRLLGHSVYGGM